MVLGQGRGACRSPVAMLSMPAEGSCLASVRVRLTAVDDALHAEREGIWRESVNLHQNAPYVLIWEEMQITG